jgi:hypothetical protein
MNKLNLLIIALAIIISILALTIFFQKSFVTEEPVSQPVQTPQLQPEKKSIVHYPVPSQPQVELPEPEQEEQQEVTTTVPELPEKLPPVQQSDESIQQALGNLKIKKSLFSLILQENFIQRLVVTIDNLPEKRLPRAHLPLMPPTGRYIVSGTTEAPQTSRRNRPRYEEHIELLEALNPEFVVKIYVHFYPLFQTAYQQLGYKNAYFNDRLVNVIDHLLETPSPPEPVQLSQPLVLYVYADPLLENLSAGQKILLRIGPEHRDKVKKILKEYRDKLANL